MHPHLVARSLAAVDPSVLEEQVMAGQLTLTLNSQREVCALTKPGGVPLDVAQILRCSKVALVKAMEISDIIKAALREDEQARQRL